MKDGKKKNKEAGKGDKDRTSNYKKYWEADYWKGKK